MKSNKLENNNLIAEIKLIFSEVSQKAYSAVNSAMVDAYWLIGKRIVEKVQNGESRAEYGKKVLENVSAALTADFGNGFSLRNIRNFRLFYLKFPDLPAIRQTLSAGYEREKLMIQQRLGYEVKL